MLSCRSPCRDACFPASPYESNTPEALRDDVPPVLRLGGVVRDCGNVAGDGAQVRRSADRSDLRDHGVGGDDFAVFRRHDRRPFLRHGTGAGVPAPGRRRRHVFRLAADDLRGRLPVAASAHPVLHADAGLDERHLLPQLADPARDFRGFACWARSLDCGRPAARLAGIEPTAPPAHRRRAGLLMAVYCLFLPHTRRSRRGRCGHRARRLGLDRWR